MSMFSAAKDHAPNASLCYLSSCMRGQNNNTVGYIDSLDTERRDEVVTKSISLAHKQRHTKRKRTIGIKNKLSKRIAMKREKKQTTDQNKVEKQLRSNNLEIAQDFPLMEELLQADLAVILAGKVVGRQVRHNRELRQKTMYNVKIEKRKKKAGGTYVIGYWSQDETYDDAVDYDVSVYKLAVDFICDDFQFGREGVKCVTQTSRMGSNF